MQTSSANFNLAESEAKNLKAKIGNSINELNSLYEKFLSSKVENMDVGKETEIPREIVLS